jgi:GxxExxY protein
MKYEELTETIIGACYDVYNGLDFGYLESVYEESLLIELEEENLNFQCQVPLDVQYKGQIVGEYVADLIVEEKVILELKSIRQLSEKHEAQLVNYLTTTGIEVGLLINFGPDGVEVKRQKRNL